MFQKNRSNQTILLLHFEASNITHITNQFTKIRLFSIS